MDWRQTLAALGVAIPTSPDAMGIALAVVFLAGAYAIGWFIGAHACTRVARALRRWTGRTKWLEPRLISTLLRYAVTALTLLVATRSAELPPLALALVAVGLGISVALFVYRISRTATLGPGPSATLAMALLAVATASLLGGTQPLISALDSLGVAIGSRRITLLDTVNFLIISGILFVAVRVTLRTLDHSLARMGRLDATQRLLVHKVAGIAVIAAAVLIGIDLLGIDLTALAVFSGAMGLAVGFGLQKTFGNLIAGVILLMDRSIKPGDVIVVGDTFGSVSKIGVRAVSVVTRDGKEHLIPNEQLMVEPVENWSYSSKNVRLHIPVGVAYSSDLALAQRLMVEAATATRRVLPEPKPSVWMKAFGDNAIEHDVLVWIEDPELGIGGVRSEILNALWRLFQENGIEVPFPQRDVHLRSVPEAVATLAGGERHPATSDAEGALALGGPPGPRSNA